MNDPFLDPNAWSGGTFDALMFLGPTSLERTSEIATWIWSYDRLDGPYRERYVPLAQQAKATPDFTTDGCEQLVGQYRHGDGERSPFVHTTIRDESGLWIYAGIPMGGFPANRNVGAYPFDDGQPLEWIPPLIDDLRLLTAHVRQRFAIPAAAYGWFTVSIIDHIEDALKGIIPEDRWERLELQTSTGIDYYPLTRPEALFRDTRGR